MRRAAVAVLTAATLVTGGAAAGTAQETRPMPGPGGQGPAMQHGGGAPHGGGGMMQHSGGGMMPGMMGMMGMGGPGARQDHLEHLMVHQPKQAARVMRFRADMLRAMGEVLSRHAAELEKAQ